MARPKKQPDAPEQANETLGAALPEAAGPRVNKMELVRKALKRLGNDAKPKHIQSYLKKRYRLDISADMVSNYKGKIVRLQADESGLIPAPEAARTTPAKEEAPTGRVSVDDVRAVKALADGLGAEKVRALLDVLYG